MKEPRVCQMGRVKPSLEWLRPKSRPDHKTFQTLNTWAATGLKGSSSLSRVTKNWDCSGPATEPAARLILVVLSGLQFPENFTKRLSSSQPSAVLQL